MESPDSWDALTAGLASANLDDPKATVDGLVCAGLVVPLGAAERAAIETAVREENGRLVTGPGPSRASRVASRVVQAGLASVAATVPDPGARRASRDAIAFAAGVLLRACAACGAWSRKWWEMGACRCGAARTIPRGDDTVKTCAACESPSPIGAAVCEACGRRFAPPGSEPQTRVQILDPDEVVREQVVSRASFTIGRDPDNDVALPWPNVARRHVRVFVDGATWAIEDLGSPGGTVLDGRQVKGRVALRADQLFDLPPLRVRLTRLPPATLLCAEVAAESEHWTLPTYLAIELQRRAARLCDGLELAVGPSFLEAQTLLPASEALLQVLATSPPDVVLGGLGGALRARLLHAIRATLAAAAATAGSMFDHHDAFQRLAALHERVAALPGSLPPMSPAQVLERVGLEASEWQREAALACESWQHMSTDDFEMWKGNRRWLSCLLTDLSAYPAARLGSTREALDAVERIAAAALVDPDTPPPDRSRAMLADRLARLRALLCSS